MKHQDFDKLLERRLSLIKQTLASKATEYASYGEGEDGLHNFRRSAAITGETPAQVCIGFFVKHMTSVLDIVEKEAKRNSNLSEGMIDEKIGDAINYLILLEAILKEEIE
jgi:hypothetical protein